MTRGHFGKITCRDPQKQKLTLNHTSPSQSQTTKYSSITKLYNTIVQTYSFMKRVRHSSVRLSTTTKLSIGRFLLVNMSLYLNKIYERSWDQFIYQKNKLKTIFFFMFNSKRKEKKKTFVRN